PDLIPSFTGSHIESTDCTVTGRSRKPVSATISAVSNFCVLAGGRTWCAFFSYKMLPRFASTTITEAALVFGIPSGVNSVGAGIVSGASFDFARARCDRARLDFDFFAFGAADSASSSASFSVTAFAFRTGPLTPLGRTISESTVSCARALSAELRISAQRNQIRLRQIMDGKLAAKRATAQVPALHMPCDPER